jgi:hypothetical protein
MGLNSFPSYNSNPATVSGVVRVRKQRDGMLVRLTNKVTGEVYDEQEVYADKEGEWVHYDNEKFVKVYHAQLRAMSHLSVTATKVLFYVFMVLPRGKDCLGVHLEECMETCGFSSRGSVYKGLEELVATQALFRKPGKLEFWINPNAFFNGNRVKYMEEQKKGG